MTKILYGFTHATAEGRILRVEQYQEKDSIAIMWRIFCNNRMLKDGLIRKPRRSTLEKYAEIADANCY